MITELDRNYNLRGESSPSSILHHPSSIIPHPSSQILLQLFRHVGLGFVQDDAAVGFGLGQQVGGAFDHVAIGSLGFDDQEHHVHVARQSRGGAELADGRHVEHNVVV